MGEAKRCHLALQTQALQATTVDASGGRIHVRWDTGASATPNAHLTFFVKLLATTGVYYTWVDSCPLSYANPRAPSRQDVLRRALSRMTPEQSQDGLALQLMGRVQAALSKPWILDIDTTIKPLCGKQSGAEISYHLHKPGRPSYTLHTYWFGNLRLVLDVVVSPGKEHSEAKARPSLIGVLEKPNEQQRPALVRRDCGFGNEPFISELEERAQPYPFKLRQSVGVKKLLTSQFARDDWGTPAPSDQCWSAVEADLALSRKTKGDPGEQIELLMPDKDVRAWEYAVLVTNSVYALEAFGQIYRDRANCENGFNALKSQWGWGGFTTQDIERCKTSARAVKHAGQTTRYRTPMHAGKDNLTERITNIRAALGHIRTVTEQLLRTDRWTAFLNYIIAKIFGPLPLWLVSERFMAAG